MVMMNREKVKVWDPAVRIFHWSLVIFFTLSYLTGEEESSLHNNAGYIVLGLVAFRLVWGLLGTRHARFTDFIYGPATTIDYARSLLARNPKHYIGHNPLGGWMIIALLVSIFITCWSGVEYIGSKGQGPLAGDGVEVITTAVANDDEHEYEEAHHEEGDDFWEEIHEVFANLSVLLVVIHIIGVVVAGHLHGENLVRAMITGYKEK